MNRFKCASRAICVKRMWARREASYHNELPEFRRSHTSFSLVREFSTDDRVRGRYSSYLANHIDRFAEKWKPFQFYDD